MGGAVFYVGKGSGNRINFHEQEARRGRGDAKGEVIRRIWDAGEQVIRRKVKENITEDEAFAIEKQLIKQYGPENLANWTVWQQDSIPDLHTALQVNLYLKGDLRDKIKDCMALDDIPFSRISFSQYVQDICFQALQQHVDQKLTS